MSADDATTRRAGPEHGAPVAIAIEGGIHLVRLAGEIDLANADDIGEHVLRETATARTVLLDLTAVGFLDSAGVRLLDRLIAAYENRGLGLRVLVAPRGPVLLTLTLCAFRADLLCTDFAGAVAALRA